MTESFVTGCNSLQFQPEVEFKPSSAAEGGTTQADEPTGTSFGAEGAADQRSGRERDAGARRTRR